MRGRRGSASVEWLVVEKKQWDRGGTSLYFHDPDGHLLELATPGVWSVY